MMRSVTSVDCCMPAPLAVYRVAFSPSTTTAAEASRSETIWRAVNESSTTSTSRASGSEPLSANFTSEAFERRPGYDDRLVVGGGGVHGAEIVS